MRRERPRLPRRESPDKAADTEALRILNHMAQADENTPFIAREMTLDQDGNSTEMIIKRDPKRGLRREFLRPAGDVLVDDNKSSWFYSPSKRRFTERESLFRHQNNVKQLMGWLRKRLRATVEGSDTVAGRATDIVRVSPVGGVFAPSRRFWIDRITGLRLKSEEYEPGGRLASSVYYTTLNLAPVFTATDFARPTPAPGIKLIKVQRKRFRNIEEAQKGGILVASPQYLPSGFESRGVETEGGDEKVILKYSNGLTLLSIIRSRLPLPPFARRVLGSDGRGFIPLPKGQRGYARQETDATWLVIGGLADEELRKVGDSLKR